MKKLVIVFLVILFLFSSALLALAHPGNTDIRGGHRDSDTGRYHYHHGYPAHQHPNGECPYDFEDKTASTDLGSSGIVSSSFDELKQQSSLNELKSLSERRLIYIIILCVILVTFFIILIRTNNKKNETEEELKQLKSKYKDEIREHESLKTDFNKKVVLCCELSIENEKLKKEIIEIDSSHFVEIDNEKRIIRKYIAAHLGLVAFKIYPSESISDYFIRIFKSANKNPLHFANPQFRGRKHEVQSLKYAKFIKEKYEAKGYDVTLFESTCTTEKYLFASNSTNKLLIQCILTQDELSDVEHIQALNNTLIDLGTINSIDNMKAVLICSCSLSDEMKDLLHKYAFNYRENIELTEEK